MDGTWIHRARACMQALGISQRQLAAELGCTRGAVGHYLSGRRNPSLEQMESMARVLRVDLLWLLRGDPPDGVHETPPADRGGSFQLPIMGSTESGLTPDLSGRLDMRLGSPACYGLRVSGSEYSPRLYVGEVAVLDPGAVTTPGDEVFVQFGNGDFGLYSLVKCGQRQITLESLSGERIRRRVDTSEIGVLHKLIAVFRPDEGNG